MITSKIKLFVFIVLIALHLVLAQDQHLTTDYTFEQFQKQFGRTYQGQERQDHRKAFNKNYQELLAIKRKNGADFQVKVNNFTDMTDQQKKSFLSYRPKQLKVPFDNLPKYNRLSSIALPSQLNYSALGKVTPIKNQGKCGACWAFTTTAIYESQLLINGAGQHDLSQQYVLSCTPDASCSGGWPNTALNSISDKGIPAENQYPYKGNKNAYNNDVICSQQQLIKLAYQVESINHYSSVPENQLKQILLSNGPVSVGVKGNNNGFLYYSGGVFSGCDSVTTQDEIDHVALLIGWTKQGNWILKNSWGRQWGQEGYAVIDGSRNCGITSFVDVLKLKKAVSTQNGQTAQGVAPNQMQNLKVKLSDSFGDGWNGYILGIRQGNQIVTVFGQQFRSGSSQGPIDIEIKSGIQTQIVVVVSGRNSQEIGFKVQDSSGNEVCTRSSGSKFSDDIIFCSFCPSCESTNKISYQLTLTDKGNNGWNGNILSFSQDGVLSSFGQQFIGGQKYGPRKIQFTKNVPVNIIPSQIGHKPEDIGFEIRDSYGNVVFRRDPGTPFAPDTKLGQFCPGCKNLFKVKTTAQLAQQYPQYASNETTKKIPMNTFIIVVAILSVLLMLVLAAAGCFLYKNRRFIVSKIPRKQSLPSSASIMFSTPTIPDETPPEKQKNTGPALFEKHIN